MSDTDRPTGDDHTLTDASDPMVRALVEERRRQGLSQREIVRRIGGSSATVTMWERGLASPTLPRTTEIATTEGYT